MLDAMPAAQTTYVVLLRGINVGGRNLIKMAALKECFERNGYSDVSTYIQSGNVLFRSRAKDVKRLTRRIEKMLAEEFSYEATVVVVSHEQLSKIVSKAPKGFGSTPAKRLCDVIFLMPPLTAKKAMRAIQVRDGVDEAVAGAGVIYYSRLKAKASSSYLPKFASTPAYAKATIRSWSTTTKLLAKLEEASVSA
jgi:uncharacterized protein (DUF1697 family)